MLATALVLALLAGGPRGDRGTDWSEAVAARVDRASARLATSLGDSMVCKPERKPGWRYCVIRFRGAQVEWWTVKFFGQPSLATVTIDSLPSSSLLWVSLNTETGGKCVAFQYAEPGLGRSKYGPLLAVAYLRLADGEFFADSSKCAQPALSDHASASAP